MAETITLDPPEVAVARTELTISSGAIKVQAATGIDWGDAEIQTYMAEQNRGETPVDFRIPNRRINIPLIIQTSGTVSFTQARQKLQAKTARIQQEGGWLKRVTSNAGTVFMDVVNATLHLPGGWMQANREFEHEATLALEALPDFYGAELTLSDHTETTAAELVFTETGVKGDYPGRVRIVVDEDDAEIQRGLIWSVRSRHYSSATTAATKYEAEALTALDTATKPALTNASGGTVVLHNALSTDWTPVMGTNLTAGTYLTHTGTNRIFARVYSTSGTAVQARFVWDVGDMTSPAENPAWRLPGASNFYIADLGEARFDAAPVGTHRWQGQIQAKGNVGSENLSVDKIWIVNADEGVGVLRAPIQPAGVGFSSYTGRDEFVQTAGALTGKVAPTGGTWTVVTNSDTTDFQVDGAGAVFRNALTDTGTGADILTGRGVTLGTTSYTGITAQVDLGNADVIFNNPSAGLLLRLTDSSNFVAAYFQGGSPSSTATLKVVKVVAGTPTVMAQSASFAASTLYGGVYYTLRAVIDVSGFWRVGFGPQGSGLTQIQLTGQDSVLATGGTLATGKIGIVHRNTAGVVGILYFDNFRAWVQPSDAVLFASQSGQLCWNGHFREDSAGAVYGPVSQVVGDLPRIPPAGLEGRTTEVFVKGSRGDLNEIADSGIDDISARVSYRPSWLFIPE